MFDINEAIYEMEDFLEEYEEAQRKYPDSRESIRNKWAIKLACKLDVAYIAGENDARDEAAKATNTIDEKPF